MELMIVGMLITMTYAAVSSSFEKDHSESVDCGNLKQNLVEGDVTELVFRNSKYSYWERPVRNANQSVEVTLNLYLRTISDVNEKGQQIKLSGYLRINWFDEIHVWNETRPLNCIEEVVMPHGEQTGVWLPDIAFTSGDRKYELTRSENELVRVRSDGYVNFAPGNSFEFQCEFNLALFPFDIQTCVMTFESWRYQTKYQHFAEPSVWIDEFHKSSNEQWQFCGGKAHHKKGNYTTGEWDWVEFEISLARKSGYYALTIILPCLLIGAVEVVTFSVSFEKTVRLEVSFTCLLAYSMFQSLMTSEMPHSADNPPLLLILISLFTIYIAMSIYLQSIGILLAWKAKSEDPVPRCLLSLVDCLAPLVCMPHLSVVTRRRNTERASNTELWLYIASVIDRYSFFFFLLLLIFTSVTLLVIVPVIANENDC